METKLLVSIFGITVGIVIWGFKSKKWSFDFRNHWNRFNSRRFETRNTETNKIEQKISSSNTYNDDETPAEEEANQKQIEERMRSRRIELLKTLGEFIKLQI